MSATETTSTEALAIICAECDREFAIHAEDSDNLNACPFCGAEDLGVVNTSARVEVDR